MPFHIKHLPSPRTTPEGFQSKPDQKLAQGPPEQEGTRESTGWRGCVVRASSLNLKALRPWTGPNGRNLWCRWALQNRRVPAAEVGRIFSGAAPVSPVKVKALLRSVRVLNFTKAERDTRLKTLSEPELKGLLLMFFRTWIECCSNNRVIAVADSPDNICKGLIGKTCSVGHR